MSNKALEQFASAMSEYAQHIASHTAAVKDLASASQELRDTVREQNRGSPKWREETVTKALKPIPGCYKEERFTISLAQEPPGCYKGLKPTSSH